MRELLLVIAVAVIYVSASEMNAQRKATEFCDSVRVGEPTRGLPGLGIDAGAREGDTGWLGEGRARQLVIPFTGMAQGSDYLCVVNEHDGIAESKFVASRSLFEPRRERGRE